MNRDLSARPNRVIIFGSFSVEGCRRDPTCEPREDERNSHELPPAELAELLMLGTAPNFSLNVNPIQKNERQRAHTDNDPEGKPLKKWAETYAL
jgi:hypothetical protein